MVSPKHANFIVNVGDCSAADIENLIYYVQREVKQQKGIELILEVKIVGENRV
jgi:UDP-N-acetylmuramate dehydrogenase